jgi:tetratricopeptide (TPR) repeat protein
MAVFTNRLGVSRFQADEYYQLALAAYGKRNLDEAVDNMNKAIEMLPTRGEYYAARGFFYLEDGVPDKAKADFDKALKIYPFEMLAHYGRGIMAYKDKNWDDALQHFTGAFRADPKRPETLYYLALVYHRKGQNTAALNLMTQAAAAFEATSDKRKSDATRWVKELQKIIANS